MESPTTTTSTRARHAPLAIGLGAALALASCAKPGQAPEAPSPEPARITTQEDIPPPVQINQVTLANGLVIEDLGTGAGEMCLPGATVRVRYTCRLPDGRVVDGSGPTPVSLSLKRMILGWQDGLPGMRVGGKRRLTVPPSLGYGSRSVRDARGDEVIPPDSTLEYEIDLLGLEPAPASAAPTTSGG